MSTATKALRKENEALKEEIQQIMMKLQQLEEKFDTKKEADGMAVHNGEVVSADKAKSIEFISNQYDDLAGFKAHAIKELKSINTRVDQIYTRCNDIAKCVEAMEEYSYQFNVKIVGMPLRAEKETPEITANLCLQLFIALGVKNVSLQDIDIAHRVPARRVSSRPNAIICKFVRRLAKNKVMEVRKEASKLQAVQLGFSPGISVQHVNIYDHLTPRLQSLLYEAKQFRQANDYKFCWVKNGQVCLRQSENSSIVKLKNIEDLVAIDPARQS